MPFGFLFTKVSSQPRRKVLLSVPYCYQFHLLDIRIVNTSFPRGSVTNPNRHIERAL